MDGDSAVAGLIFTHPTTMYLKRFMKIARMCARQYRGVALVRVAVILSLILALAQVQSSPKTLDAMPLKAAEFPLPPLNGKPLVIPNPLNIGNALDVRIEAPVTALPPGYPQAQVINGNPEVSGRLIYALRLKHKFFLLHVVGQPKEEKANPRSFAAYPAEAYDAIFGPQFAPDGQSLLFKVGWPFERYGSYDLFLWQFASQDLKPVTGHDLSLYYPFVYWSPDSRYLAYVTGVDASGYPAQETSDTRLFTYDVQSGSSRQIANGLAPELSSENVSWTSANTLLMARYADDAQRKGKAGSSDSVHPGIYEVPVTGDKTKLIAPSGISPVASPNNKYIAFSGWAIKQPGSMKVTALDNAEPTALYIFDRAKSMRKAIRATAADYLRWTPNGDWLIAINITYQPDAHGGRNGKASMEVIKAGTWKSESVVTIEAHDYKQINRGLSTSQFRPLGLSKDGKFLFMDVSEYTGMDEANAFFVERKSLRAIDLKSGRSYPVAQLINKWGSVIGWDWHDETFANSAENSKSVAAKVP